MCNFMTANTVYFFCTVSGYRCLNNVPGGPAAGSGAFATGAWVRLPGQGSNPASEGLSS